jgi:hypothetical protein
MREVDNLLVALSASNEGIRLHVWVHSFPRPKFPQVNSYTFLDASEVI